MMFGFSGSMLSFDIIEEEPAIHLLKEIMGLWLTIYGYTIVSTWIEQYKREIKSNTKKKKDYGKT